MGEGGCSALQPAAAGSPGSGRDRPDAASQSLQDLMRPDRGAADAAAARSARPLSPSSRGRAARSLIPPGPSPYVSSNPLFRGADSYSEVCQHADRLFNRIRKAVACRAAPATLKSSILEPLRTQLAPELFLDLFAKSDNDFMTMFSVQGAVSALEAKRDALTRRVDGLVKCKNEFQELAKCL